MILYGLDFTSAPSARKPITCAQAHLEGNLLMLDSLDGFGDWAGFERFLQREGQWLAGIDFPFGQPARFIQAMGWGNTWADYVRRIGQMSASEWAETVKRYCDAQPLGDKQHQGRVDSLARYFSPMKVDYTPVGKMFHQGAPRLLAAGVNLPGLHPTSAQRTVLEAYPKLVARALIPTGGPYKSDDKHKQTEAQRQARQALVAAAQGHQAEQRYGLRLKIVRPMVGLGQQLVNDASGDSLDAVLAAMQAAWASRQPRYGQPIGLNPLEGWMADIYADPLIQFLFKGSSQDIFAIGGYFYNFSLQNNGGLVILGNSYTELNFELCRHDKEIS